MSEMIERVAKAMWNADGGDRGVAAYPDIGDYRPLARAAIEAMKTPTEAMLKAAEATNGGSGYFTPEPAEAWPAMINSALSDDGGAE